MDFIIIAQLLVVLFFIFIGARLGGIGIGFAGATGVLVLCLFFGLKTSPKDIPFDVISIIMAVIAAVSAMQIAGGMDWMVDKAENFLRSNPKRIVFYAPIVTYLTTIFAGTQYTAFSTLPVIAEVAKGQGIRPSRPLSMAVVAAQIAITASPVSAAFVAFASIIEPYHVSYIKALEICFPTTFVACMIGAFVAQFLGKDLKDDPIYQERLEKGLVKANSSVKREILPTAKTSVIIFLITIVAVVLYATAISKSVEWIKNPVLHRNEAIVTFMMTAATAIVLLCKVDTSKITQASTFRSGMSAIMCILGVAWLGTVFVNGNLLLIKSTAQNVLTTYPWLLAVVFFFASMLLYSQAATAKALLPAALVLGVSPVSAVAAFGATAALFVLPTYPTLIAAIEMDDTGSTRIGKYVFNHPFFIPGMVTIISSVAIGFVMANLLL